MRKTWLQVVAMGMMLVALGCRTPKPVLKPAPVEEALNIPPSEKRYDTSVYPKEAFNKNDPTRRLEDQTITPVKGPGPTTPGMMPGSGPGMRQ